jgi:hypothetical protein
MGAQKRVEDFPVDYTFLKLGYSPENRCMANSGELKMLQQIQNEIRNDRITNRTLRTTESDLLRGTCDACFSETQFREGTISPTAIMTSRWMQ